MQLICGVMQLHIEPHDTAYHPCSWKRAEKSSTCSLSMCLELKMFKSYYIYWADDYGNGYRGWDNSKLMIMLIVIL